ncbi:MAG: ABC transporter permease subunit, partial [Anaerolineae bacterium]|nr:ABC transporter permease subunit [Anaerolineae bacterium]
MTQSRLQPVNSAATQADAGRISLTDRGSAWLGLVTLFGQRLAFGGLVLLAIIYLSYLGLDMARGAAFGEAAGLAFSKSFAYLGHLLQGDLGLTAAGTITGNPAPVASVMPQLVLNSLGLLLVSLLVAGLLGVGLGLLAAQRRRSNWSVAIIIASMIGISVPSFFAAPLLQLLMVQWTRTFGEPLLPLGGFGWDKRLILPALVLAARPAAQITRMTLVSLSEVLGQDFIRVAQGKGLRGYLILWRHELPNIAIPVLTTVGLSLRFSLSSLPVVEFFFG